MISNHKIQMMCLEKFAGFVGEPSNDLFHRMLAVLQINILFEKSHFQLVDMIQSFQCDIETSQKRTIN
jgi:hypothetical protein